MTESGESDIVWDILDESLVHQWPSIRIGSSPSILKHKYCAVIHWKCIAHHYVHYVSCRYIMHVIIQWWCHVVCQQCQTVCTMQGVAEILAAMTPCSRLYGYLGLELAAAYSQTSHAYKDWILTYSSPAYLALPEAKEALLDNLGQECDFGKRPHAARHLS